VGSEQSHFIDVQSSLHPTQHDVVDALLVAQFQERLAPPGDESEEEAGVLVVVLDRWVVLRTRSRRRLSLSLSLSPAAAPPGEEGVNKASATMADEDQMERKEEATEIAPFDPTKKKKKKKVVIQDPADDVDKLAEKTESLAVTESGEPSFAGLKKKKKKHVELDPSLVEAGDGEDALDDQIGEDEQGEGIVLGGTVTTQYPWEGTDRDYKYDELLGRVFNILRENNPDLAGDRRRTVMRPPQVLREGTKKTVFVNFMDLCKTMHRQPEHVMMFLLAEMGTSGSLDGQQRLVIKGRFAPKNFEAILRRYINEYVICNGCKSPDTILSKENRLFFLRCEQCGSSRSVAPIKAGFVAQVGRRKAGT